MIGINVNDKYEPFTEMIFSGEKTVETRKSPSLDPYIGQRVGIVKTGKGKAVLVGFATIGKPVYYETEESFRKDESKHRVLKGSKYDNGKWGYPLINPLKTNERYIDSRGIIARKI